jgi:hypothetical protein
VERRRIQHNAAHKSVWGGRGRREGQRVWVAPAPQKPPCPNNNNNNKMLFQWRQATSLPTTLARDFVERVLAMVERVKRDKKSRDTVVQALSFDELYATANKRMLTLLARKSFVRSWASPLI